MITQNNNTDKQFAAIVLAADRTGKDPITQYTNAACKAFASVDGIPMVIRVLNALQACPQISSIILCGPPETLHHHCPELKQRIDSGQVAWIPNLNSPSRSADSGLKQIPDNLSVLVTTADHALLTSQIVQQFLQQSIATTADATVGIVRQEQIAAAFPGSKRTVIRLRDGGVCGCNLFAFTPNGRSLVQFWRQAEDLRKKPWQLIARVLGFKTVFAYLLGILTRDQGVAAVSQKSGVNIQTIELDDPRAGVDVDKVEDLQLAEAILKNEKQTQWVQE